MHLTASFQNTLGGVIRMLVQLLTIPLLIWQIGLQDYGLWVLVSAVMGMISLVEGGLTVSTTVYVSRDLVQKNAGELAQTLTVTLGSMLGLATVAAAILWFSAAWTDSIFVKLEPTQREVAATALKLSAVVAWARLLQQVFVGIEQAHHRYGLMNTVNTVQQVLSNVGMLLIAALGGRIVAFMKWQILVSASMLVLHAWVSWKLLRCWNLRPIWNPLKGREIGRYSLMTWLASLGTMLFSQCDRVVVGILLPTSALGIYAAITSVTAQISVFSALPVQPLLPLVSQFAANLQETKHALRSRLQHAMQLHVVLVLGIGASLSLFAPLIVHLMLPAAGEEVVTLFRISTLICSVYALNAPGYFILLGMGKAGVCTRVVVLSGVVALLWITLGTWMKGLLGAVCGTAGYILTLRLTFLGLRQVDCLLQEWLAWVRLPIGWFILVLPINWWMPDQLVWKVPLLVVESGLIGAWWLSQQRMFVFPFSIPKKEV